MTPLHTYVAPRFAASLPARLGVAEGKGEELSVSSISSPDIHPQRRAA